MSDYAIQVGTKFLDEDYNSGGYPYEVDSAFRAKRFKTPAEPFEWLGSLRTSYPNARVVSVEIRVSPVPQEFINKSVAEAALSKLTDEEKAVLGFLV